MTQRNP